MTPQATSPAWAGPLPVASPPSTMRLYQLPTGMYETRAALAVTGGRFRDRRRFAATAVLVVHPAGDLLIDAGFGARLDEHVRMLPRVERAPYQRLATAREQLDRVGYRASNLLGVLVTHVHWDHVSGLDSLDAPIWLTGAERAYGESDPHGAVFRAVAPSHEIREYELDGPAYLGFPASRDIHGDGSVVVAGAGGHTPGSVVVFVSLPTGERFGFIGDLTWQLDGIERGAERPWFLRRVADVDAAVVRSRLAASIALRDVVHLVPSHDQGAYDPIPVLTRPVGEGVEP